MVQLINNPWNYSQKKVQIGWKWFLNRFSIIIPSIEKNDPQKFKNESTQLYILYACILVVYMAIKYIYIPGVPLPNPIKFIFLVTIPHHT